MTTKELIAELQKQDPSGEAIISTPSGPVYFIEKDDYYWDGRPEILIRDETNKNSYNIIGIKQATSGMKVRFHTLSLEDVIYDCKDIETADKLIIEGDERYLKRAAKIKEEFKIFLEDLEILRLKLKNKPPKQK